jgi:hypothetical protein
MRFSSVLLPVLVLTTRAAIAVASEDLTIVSKHTHDGKPVGTSTSYLASDRIRMARESGHETIMDLKTGVITTLDGTKKTYYSDAKQDMVRPYQLSTGALRDPHGEHLLWRFGPQSSCGGSH